MPAATLLSSASDEELQDDLGRQLKFQEYVAPMSLTLDMALTSSKHLLLIELTAHWEDRMEEANDCTPLKQERLESDLIELEY